MSFPPLSLKKTHAIGFRACPNSGWSHLKILILITLAKTLSPNKFRFTSSRWTYLLGDHQFKPFLDTNESHESCDIPSLHHPAHLTLLPKQCQDLEKSFHFITQARSPCSLLQSPCFEEIHPSWRTLWEWVGEVKWNSRKINGFLVSSLSQSASCKTRIDHLLKYTQFHTSYCHNPFLFWIPDTAFLRLKGEPEHSWFLSCQIILICLLYSSAFWTFSYDGNCSGSCSVVYLLPLFSPHISQGKRKPEIAFQMLCLSIRILQCPVWWKWMCSF